MTSFTAKRPMLVSDVEGAARPLPACDPALGFLTAAASPVGAEDLLMPAWPVAGHRFKDLWAGRRFWHALGFDAAPISQGPSAWLDLIHPDDVDRALELKALCDADPQGTFDAVFRFTHRSGALIWIRVQALAIEEAGSDGRFLLLSDVTAMAEKGQRAARLKDDLLRVEDELRDFAYGVSHDLKSPANAARILLTDIADGDRGQLSADQRELLDFARDNARRMSDLIDGVLDYARLIGAEIEIRPVDLSELAHGVLDEHHAQVDASGASVAIGALPRVDGDPAQLARMLHHLIDNALKYASPDRDPVIEIAADAAAQGTVIRVADNGLGIEPRHQARIFEMFTRLHTRDRIGGSGLGLPICQRVARNHGGHVTVSSRIGSGSVFTVILDREPA